MYDDASEIYLKIREKVYNYISASSKTSYEVEAKIIRILSKYEHLTDVQKEELVDTIINELKEQKFVDDLNYALKYVEQQFRSNSPKSPLEVKMFLKNKRISPEYLDRALNLYSDDEQKKAIEKFISKKNYDEKKMISYLTRKGFDYYLVKSSLDAV